VFLPVAMLGGGFADADADDDGYSDSLEGQRSFLAYTTLMADPSLKHVGSNTAYIFFSFLLSGWGDGWMEVS